jgi:hypothetical protein
LTMRPGRLVIAITMIACVLSDGPASLAEPIHATAVTDIRDIRGPLSDSGPPPFLLSSIFLLVASGLAMSGIMMERRRKSLTPPAIESRCNRLADLELLAADYRKGIYPSDHLCIRLAELVRNGIADRSGLPVNCLTTQELLGHHETPGLLTSGVLALIGEILAFTDRVKFAGHCPDTGEVEWVLAASRELLSGLSSGKTP